ncbi:S-layer homology domain-containing protein [Symbiobacterium thermophilum]|uniref:S-layer homology domain-containing protein n=1 Tax=Symbiobacterium thermophilum TaxID=2734 RepID=UPI0035C73044
MRRPVCRVGLIALLILLIPGAALAYLSDVAGHWSAVWLSALEARGIIAGDRAGRFYPDDPLTRAELARIAVTGLGYGTEALALQGVPSRFTDVAPDDPLAGYVELLWELGLTEGYPDGRFRPEAPLTRVELAAMLVRAAGLEQRAAVLRSARLSYRDAGEIPAWAVGAVAAAAEAGLMSGDGDGYYRPWALVTRAEGAAAVAQWLDQYGLLFDLEGTLVAFDPREGEGTVRTPMGEEHSISLAVDAAILRGGERVLPPALQVADQVSLILNDAGQVRFVEAWYADLLAEGLEPAGGNGVWATLGTGQRRRLWVQPGALVFVNGRPATLAEALGQGPTYMALDVKTEEVRYLDAVRTPFGGRVAVVEDDRIWLEDGDGFLRYDLASDAILVDAGRRVEFYEIAEGDQVAFALDGDGRITYLEIVR